MRAASILSAIAASLIAASAAHAESSADAGAASLGARPGAAATLKISLAVAQARCTGRHGQMVARYRPQLLRLQAGPLRQDDAAMAARYRQAHGAGWEQAMAADLAALRQQMEQAGDLKRFCREQALEARTLVFDAAGRDRATPGVDQPASQAFESFMLGRPARGPISRSLP